MDTQSSVILSISLTVYVLYTLTFTTCIWILLRSRVPNYKWHLTTICFLFAAITTSMSIFIAGTELVVLNYLYNTLVLMAHIVADVILVWRCFLIWERKWHVIAVPLILLSASMVFGIMRVVHASLHPFSLHSIHPPPSKGIKIVLVDLIGFYVVSLLANLLLTILSAGRIWYLSQRGKAVLEESHRSQYHAAVVIIVESGVVYSLVLLAVIVNLTVGRITGHHPGIDFAMGIVVSLALQASGLMPTLILVRSALAKERIKKENLTSTISQLRATRPATQVELSTHFDTSFNQKDSVYLEEEAGRFASKNDHV